MRVLIVGAGIIGLSVADELLRRGVHVELFERGQPGREASWAAAGILSPQGEAKEPGALLELLRLGFQLIPETVTRLEKLTQIDLQFRASGMLVLAFSKEDEEELEGQLRWQKGAGLRFEPVTASQVRELEPAVDGPLRRGIWWPQTAQLDNRRMVQAYQKLVEIQGGIIHPNVPVKCFLLKRDQVQGVETPQGKVFADWVVNCAGPWAGFDTSLAFPIPSVPVKGQILQYRTDRPLVKRILKSPKAYLVQRSDQELIAGTTVEYVGYDKEVTGTGRQSIEEGSRQISSLLSTLPLETAWAGLRPGSPDGLPILGPTPLRKLLLATGHFRNGILLAPLTGKWIADWITTGACSIDLAPFGVSRFLARATC